jgi:predicted nucleotidyltransferase
MIRARDIESVVEEIAERFKPNQIILFGSYAYGTPTEDSDVDLMVVKRYRGDSAEAAYRVHDAIDVPFRTDVLVRSPAEIRRRVAWGDMFIVGVVERGILLHDSSDRRVGEQGRRRLHRRLRSAAIAKAQPV